MAFFLWCYVCFVLLRFSSLCFRSSHSPSFNRPSICRRADSHMSFFFSFFLSLFLSIFFWYHFRFLFVWRVNRTFFLSGWYFFYLVTTGWIFDISLCENSINPINQKMIRAGHARTLYKRYKHSTHCAMVQLQYEYKHRKKGILPVPAMPNHCTRGTSTVRTVQWYKHSTRTNAGK